MVARVTRMDEQPPPTALCSAPLIHIQPFVPPTRCRDVLRADDDGTTKSCILHGETSSDAALEEKATEE